MSYTDHTRALDDLLARVAVLERETAELKKQVGNLWDDLFKSVDNYQNEFGTIHALLRPLLYKEFPGYKAASDQFQAIVDARTDAPKTPE